jgi:hypothetical protein
MAKFNLGRIITIGLFGLAMSFEIPQDPNAPATQTFDNAKNYCESKGLRLPTLNEYILALQSGLFSLPTDSNAEWLTDEEGNPVLIDLSTLIIGEDNVEYELLPINISTTATFRCAGPVDDGASEAF